MRVWRVSNAMTSHVSLVAESSRRLAAVSATCGAAVRAFSRWRMRTGSQSSTSSPAPATSHRRRAVRRLLLILVSHPLTSNLPCAEQWHQTHNEYLRIHVHIPHPNQHAYVWPSVRNLGKLRHVRGDIMAVWLRVVTECQHQRQCLETELSGVLVKRCDELYDFNVDQKTRDKCVWVHSQAFLSCTWVAWRTAPPENIGHHCVVLVKTLTVRRAIY